MKPEAVTAGICSALRVFGHVALTMCQGGQTGWLEDSGLLPAFVGVERASCDRLIDLQRGALEHASRLFKGEWTARGFHHLFWGPADTVVRSRAPLSLLVSTLDKNSFLAPHDFYASSAAALMAAPPKGWVGNCIAPQREWLFPFIPESRGTKPNYRPGFVVVPSTTGLTSR